MGLGFAEKANLVVTNFTLTDRTPKTTDRTPKTTDRTQKTTDRNSHHSNQEKFTCKILKITFDYLEKHTRNPSSKTNININSKLRANKHIGQNSRQAYLTERSKK